MKFKKVQQFDKIIKSKEFLENRFDKKVISGERKFLFQKNNCMLSQGAYIFRPYLLWLELDLSKVWRRLGHKFQSTNDPRCLLTFPRDSLGPGGDTARQYMF